jgi:hypothetical protein
MLSKFANVNSDSKNTLVTCKEYILNNIDLKKYTIPELKTIARNYKIGLSGKKADLIERLDVYFKQSNYAIQIQKNIRRHFVKRSIKLRGEALYKRNICVNDTDFSTMEPLDEIPAIAFFSFRDEKGNVYGFDMLSLLKWLNQKTVFINPYNREPIDTKIKNNLIELLRLVKILCISYLDKDVITMIKPTRSYTNRFIRARPSPRRVNLHTPNYNESPVENVIIQTNSDISGSQLPIQLTNESQINRPLIPPSNREMQTNYNQYIQENRERFRVIAEKMVEVRGKPIQTRINEAFMEIDHLGNYTQGSWFSNLELGQYILLYRTLYNIWNFHGIPPHVKRCISPLQDPFTNIYIDRITREEIQTFCLKIIEDLVFSGIDAEYRKLGALHILRALTVVSLPARQSLPWLYESM